MDKMPFYEPPYPEETHYSHILRLAKLNGFDNFLDFYNHFLTFNANRVRTVSHDSVQNLIPFFTSAMPPDSFYSDYILNTTSYSYHAMFIGERKRIGIVNKMFTVDYRFRYSSHLDKKTLCYCPDCMTKTPYYKRVHQIPVVKFCPIHKSPLYVYTGKKTHELDFPLQGEELPYSLDASLEIQIAEFVQELVSSNLDISKNDIQNVITNKVNEFGGLENFVNSLYNSNFKTIFKDKHYIRYLLKENLKISKAHDIELTVIMVFLFECFANFMEYLSSNSLRQKNMDFDYKALEYMFSTENYDLISDYRRNLISVRHNDCAHYFVSTPYAMLNGWKCPYCSRHLSNEDFQRRMVQCFEDGNYTLIAAAETLWDKITIKHEKCGNVKQIPYTSFLFSGYICACKKRMDRSEAQKMVKSYGDLELLKYTKSKAPIEIKCNKCGNIIKYRNLSRKTYFRCNICNPNHLYANETKRHTRQHHVLTLAAAKSTVADITGDRYELLDMYGSGADKRRDVLLRHNECGKEYHTDYHIFVAGKGRCDCERHNLIYPDGELKRYIYDISGHRYICVDDKIKRKSVTIKDTITGEVIKIQYWRAVQELTRPTHSELLPCETKVPNACKPRTAPMLLMNYLKETYGNDGVFFLSDISFKASKGWIKTTISDFLRQGSIKNIKPGIYTFTEVESNWDYITKLFYIRQNNVRHGCTYGKSFLQDLGIKVENPTIYLQIMSNKIYSTSPKKIDSYRKIGSVKVHLKNAPCNITEDNYKVLQVADYFCYYYNRYYPSLTEKEMDIVANYIRTVPIKVINETILLYPEAVQNKIKSML